MAVMTLVFGLAAISMGEKMNKLKMMLHKRPVLWLVVLLALLATAATVYGVLPAISLDSPTSFPVDI